MQETKIYRDPKAIAEKFNKELLTELFDITFFHTSPEHSWIHVRNTDKIRKLLLKNKLIKSSTKIINCDISRRFMTSNYEGGRMVRTELEDPPCNISVRNGRGDTIFTFKLNQSQITEVMSNINS